MREFKLSSGYFWREFAFFNLVVFLLRIIHCKDTPPSVPAIVLVVFNAYYVVQYAIWPPLKKIIIEPAAQALSYKLLWRPSVNIEIKSLTVKSGTWTTRGGLKAGLLFYSGSRLLFRAAKGPWKESDLVEIYRLTAS